MATHKDGRPCTCGRIGCYEAYAACRVFTTSVSERMGKPMNGREIFQPENLQNPIIIDEIDKWEDEIALLHFQPKSYCAWWRHYVRRYAY